ncbi:MAG: hypothetical protein IKL82_01615 [Clostridia bacterium]|nr:hypothetical protein [Clostridia bacterium]
MKIKKLNSKQTKIIAIVALALVFVTAVVIVLTSLFGNKTTTGYDVNIYKNTETNAEQITSVDLYANVTEGGRFRIDEIWINLSNLKDESVTIYVSKGTDTDEQATTSSTKLLKTVTLKRSQINFSKDGWFMIYKGDGFETGKRPQIKIGFNARVTVNEITMVDTNGKQPALKVTGASIGEAPTTSGTNWNKITSFESGSSHEVANADNLNRIIDEQDTFNHFPKKD